MSLPELTQATTLIEKATRIALFVPYRTSTDALATMIALYLALQSSKEDGVDEVSAQHVPEHLQFLPGSSQVRTTPQSQAEIIIDVAGPLEIAGVRQEPLQGGVRLHLALPEGMSVTKDHLEMTIRPLPYDLVIVLGATDLENLGTLFTDYTTFFYNTPVINIDHRASNEHFGTVNLVDITAGSVAEVAYELVRLLVNGTIDAGIATALYAGVIAGTDSFQKPSTTPRSFQVAAKLMELGADREAVIQHLVKTKPLALIKLAGRLYARLRYDQYLHLFWSILRPGDFTESGATSEDVPRAIRELTNNIAGFHAAFVLEEQANQRFLLHIVLGKGLEQRREEIQAELSAQRDNGLLHVELTNTTLEAAEQEALDKVRSILP